MSFEGFPERFPERPEKSFEKMPVRIERKVLEALKRCGIERLNELQIRSAEVILEGKDCLIVAPTGSGKTEAAVVPALSEIIRRNYSPIALIYVTPLRALNRDMLRRLEVLMDSLGLRIAVRHGDTSRAERVRQSRLAPHVLVTTPETFQILFLGKKLREWLKNVKFLVIDEVHELFQSERGAQLSVAVERLREIASFQTICLSATVREKEKVSRFFTSNKSEIVEGYYDKPYSFRVVKPGRKEEDERIAEELFVDGDVASQLRYIAEIVKKHSSTLIFVNTRQTAEALALKLKKLAEVEVHHGSLSKEARLEAERKLLSGEIRALICTSSMELGIDVGHVDCVIQFNSPRQVSRLLQRVGRSGHRAGEISKGYVIASSFDEIMESWVIADRALRGEIEKERCHELSLDTLANQIAAIAMEYGGLDAEKVYRIIRRAYPFRNLSRKMFLEICVFLNERGVIGLDFSMDAENLNDLAGIRIFPKRKTRKYFYDNVSMIPDEKKYRVVDVTSGRCIGSLDEVFVTTFRGEVFAMRGELWRIVDVGDVVKVEPVSGEGEIPSWVGEEIPVPFEVAQEVGELREIVKRTVDAAGREKTVKMLMERFSTTREACEVVVDIIERTDIVPSDRTVTVEQGEGFVVVNACFGHTVNEVFGRIIATLLSARRATSVSVEIDPYRINLYPAKVGEVMKVLENMKEAAQSMDGIRWLAERALIDTKLLQWKVVSSARKFGVMSKNADITRMNLKKLVLKLKDTPVYREAVRELLTERFDVERLYEVLNSLFDSIDVVAVEEPEKLSPISRAARQQTFDLLVPSKPTSAIIHVFKKRLESEFCWLYCVNCGCRIRVQVSRVEEPVRCIRCKSRLVACVNARRNPEEYSRGDLLRIANLVMSYGRRAVYAMNTHGVGAETAARIPAKYYRSEEEFFRELLEAEKRYIRTRKFWS